MLGTYSLLCLTKLIMIGMASCARQFRDLQRKMHLNCIRVVLIRRFRISPQHGTLSHAICNMFRPFYWIRFISNFLPLPIYFCSWIVTWNNGVRPVQEWLMLWGDGEEWAPIASPIRDKVASLVLDRVVVALP